jgi:hypothetical protein
MLARVLVQVDELGCRLDGAESRLFHGKGRARKGDHGAVVIQVRRAVQQARALDGFDRSDDLVDHFRTSRFGKVGDTFD